ncbi:MAG: hypothetical protein AAF610_00445 [Pseudomonadota bacterium]
MGPRLKLVVALTIFTLLSGCVTTQGTSTTPSEDSIKTLMRELQVAINHIGANASQGALPPLSTATVVLSSKVVDSTTGSASLVLTSKTANTTSDSNTLELIFKPSQGAGISSDSGVGEKIGEAVIDAIKGISDAQGLSLSSLKVTAGLDIISSTTGGLDIEIAGVAISGAAGKTITTGHSIILLFKRPD